MKICIPCSHADIERGQLHTPYDAAPFFAFWDSATDHFEFEHNPLLEKDDACVCSLTRWVRKLGAQVFISADIGRRAAARLIQAGVKSLQATEGSVREVLMQCRAGRLPSSPTGERTRNCSHRSSLDDGAPAAGACCGQGHRGAESHVGCKCRD